FSKRPDFPSSLNTTTFSADVDLWLQDSQKLADVAAAWAYLLESTRTLNLQVVEPFVKFRQDFYRYRTLTEAAVVERLLALMAHHHLPVTLAATPELLALDLPVHPQLHLSGLGTALTDDTLLERALHLLAAGLTADMGLLPPAPRPGLPSRPVQVDLGWFQPFDLFPEVDNKVAPRALRLAVQGKDCRLAFSVASLLSLPLSRFPQVFAWLGHAVERRRDWGATQPAVTYSFSDWLRATRLLPAQHLGLTDRGHLQPGARGDLALYDLPTASNWTETCQRCRLLFKAGALVVHNYEVVRPQVAKATYYRRTQAIPNKLVADICQKYSLRPEHLQVRAQPHLQWQQVT
ncbi:MAG: amidohydrolase family protein, partial [Desulfobacca sp.]|uniref:amidohydrolase family protein n=1 Tax=Desulfobacca sp. TaxID=2067990 RepID=UPI00404A454D